MIAWGFNQPPFSGDTPNIGLMFRVHYPAGSSGEFEHQLSFGKVTDPAIILGGLEDDFPLKMGSFRGQTGNLPS